MRYLRFLILFLLLFLVQCNDAGCGEDSTGPENGLTPSGWIVYPQDSLGGVSLTPLFTWKAKDADSDVLEFDLTFWNSNDESEKWSYTSLTDTFFTSPVELKPDTWYRVKMDTKDSDGHVDKYPNSGLTHSFRTGSDYNNPPFRPEILYPVSHYNVPLDTIFYWTCSDPDPADKGKLTYDLSVWKNLPGLAVDTIHVYDIADTFSAVPTLEYNTKYGCRVVAVDPAGDSNTSISTAAYTITSDPPGEPYAPDPAHNSSGVLITTDISWSCDHPDGLDMTYDVYFGKQADGPPPLVSEGVAGTTWSPPTDLETSTSYLWKIVAKDGANETEGPTWAFLTESSGGEFFAVLTVSRTVFFQDPDIYWIDAFTARFDEEYAPCDPVIPVQPDSVWVSTGETVFELQWLDYADIFSYTDYINGWFLDPGATYQFSVAGGGVLPGFIKSIDFPSCEHYITSPEPFSYLSLDGFELQWNSTCPGDIDIVILDTASDSTGIHITTENDGSYTFTADDLSPLPESTYEFDVILVEQNIEPLNVYGFDSRSWIWARVLSGAHYYKQ